MAITSYNNYVDGSSVHMARISPKHLPGLEEGIPESRSSNYAFIKGPDGLNGRRIEDPEAQKIILEWLERERARGHKLVGSFATSTTWLFEVTPNSVRFIKDEF